MFFFIPSLSYLVFFPSLLILKLLHAFIHILRTYVIHLLGAYVTILCNWLIL